jgi:hypothetical protein
MICFSLGPRCRKYPTASGVHIKLSRHHVNIGKLGGHSGVSGRTYDWTRPQVPEQTPQPRPQLHPLS